MSFTIEEWERMQVEMWGPRVCQGVDPYAPAQDACYEEVFDSRWCPACKRQLDSIK